MGQGEFSVPIGGVVTHHDGNRVKIVDDEGEVNLFCRYILVKKTGVLWKISIKRLMDKFL